MNLVGRGTLSAPIKRPLCDRAQSDFDAFVSMPVVSMGQLYGGKIFEYISIPLEIEIHLEREEKEGWKYISPDEAL